MVNTVQVAAKSDSFYRCFSRKEENQLTTHYCPGCGHGIIHKLVASVIDQLKVQDRTIFLSPVGCSVFAYYYFDTGNIQCSHGRAPAVATGVKRALEDAVVISYQGDGDLASIGMTEIIHAANRGELFTVIFINNATYGMTGGQMAPTTPLGEKSVTSPTGRSFDNDGMPLKMAELIATLEAPVFVQRCSVTTTKEILSTKRAIRKALENQINRVGFSFIEILSPCPTNWKMDPLTSRRHVNEVLTKTFPLKNFKDIQRGAKASKGEKISGQELMDFVAVSPLKSRPAPAIKEHKIIIAGFGGQGILFASKLLATCALIENYQVTYLPSYGPEMRGGEARVDLTISGGTIGSPLIEECDYLLALNQTALNAFKQRVKRGGKVFRNTSLAPHESDLDEIALPATELAQEHQVPKGANIVLVSALLKESKLFTLQTLKEALEIVLEGKEGLTGNLKLAGKAFEYFN